MSPEPHSDTTKLMSLHIADVHAISFAASRYQHNTALSRQHWSDKRVCLTNAKFSISNSLFFTLENCICFTSL